MTRTRIAAAACALVLFAFWTQAQDETPRDTLTKTNEHDGVVLSVELKKEQGAGGPYFVQIHVTNGSKQNVGLNEFGYYRAFDLAIVDEAGKSVPYTRFGRRYVAGAGTRGKTRVIGPGKFHGRYYNLARIFDLSEEGRYRLTVRKAFFPKMPVLKRSATLEVKDVVMTVRNPTEKDRRKWR